MSSIWLIEQTCCGGGLKDLAVDRPVADLVVDALHRECQFRHSFAAREMRVTNMAEAQAWQERLNAKRSALKKLTPDERRALGFTEADLEDDD